MTKAEEIAALAAAVYPGIIALQVECRADGSNMDDATCHENPIDASIEVAHEIWRKVNNPGAKS